MSSNHVRLTVMPKDARDFAVRTLAGIIRQDGFGYNPISDACRYRTSEGRACAIGLWLPDDAPEKVLNFLYGGTTLAEIHGGHPKVRAVRELYNKYPDVFCRLQHIHDSAAKGKDAGSDMSVVDKLRQAHGEVGFEYIDHTVLEDAVKMAESDTVL